MKYKVGDTVRVRKDLEVGKYYGKRYMFNHEMDSYKGKELTITNICQYSCGDYYYKVKENGCSWIDKMLEPVEDIEFKEFLKGKVIIKVENKNELQEFYKLMTDNGFKFFSDLETYILGFSNNSLFRYCRDNSEIISSNSYMDEKTITYNDFIHWQEDIIEYKGKKYEVINSYNNVCGDEIIYAKEHKEEILDEAEKEYLRNVIKYVIEPTHNEVDYIEKYLSLINSSYYISLQLKNGDFLPLPSFKDKRMYKGMELDEEYTLEQLGLDK